MTYVPPPPPPPPPSAYNAPAPTPTVPPELETIRVFFLVSLIVNALATLIWLLSAIGLAFATCGVGCLLIALPIVSGTAIVLDAMALSRFNQPHVATESFLRIAAIFDIVSGFISMSIVPLVMGILALVYLQKPSVQHYYRANAA